MLCIVVSAQQGRPTGAIHLLRHWWCLACVSGEAAPAQLDDDAMMLLRCPPCTTATATGQAQGAAEGQAGVYCRCVGGGGLSAGCDVWCKC